MAITIIGEIWNTGTSSVITIPKAFITSKMLKVGGKYEIKIEEEES